MKKTKIPILMLRGVLVLAISCAVVFQFYQGHALHNFHDLNQHQYQYHLRHHHEYAQSLELMRLQENKESLSLYSKSDDDDSRNDGNNLHSKKDKNNSSGGRPSLQFVFHVGLPKTATTHLQCRLCGDLGRTEPILGLDNWVYLGTCPWGECGGSSGGGKLTGLPPQFLRHQHTSFFVKFSSGGPPQFTEPNANPVGPFPHGLDPKRVGASSFAAAAAAPSTPQLCPDFIQRVLELYRQRRNVLVIFEGADGWSQAHIQVLSAFLKSLFQNNVHIVVAYRPLYEWLPSKYNSVIKPPRNRAARVWPGHALPLRYAAATASHDGDDDDSDSDRDSNDQENTTQEKTTNGTRRRRRVPHVLLGEEVLPFALDHRSAGHSPFLQRSVDHDNYFGEYVRDIAETYQMHPTHIVQHNYGQFFDKDKIHTMSLTHISSRHDKDDDMKDEGVDPLLEWLFCDMLPDSMPQTCRYVRYGRLRQSPARMQNENKKQGKTTTVAINPSVNLNYDILAVHAFQMGLIHVEGEGEEEEPSRSFVTELIQQRQEETLKKSGNEFTYLNCLDEYTLDRLEKLSWKVERNLFFPDAVDFFAQQQQSQSLRRRQEQQQQYQELHHDGFIKAVKQGKFCNIDANKTLQYDNDGWRTWFVQNFAKPASDDDSNDEGPEEEDQENNKPLFILHVGLAKTATKHLQCSLCGNAATTQIILGQDRLLYLGTCPVQCGVKRNEKKGGGGGGGLANQPFIHHHNLGFFKFWPLEEKGNPLGPFPHALDPNRTYQGKNLPLFQPDFARRIRQLGAQQQQQQQQGSRRMGGIIVFEGADSWSQRNIRALSKLLRRHWQVHVVVGYRPLFDWLPSKYNSIVKPPRNKAARVWPGQVTDKHNVEGQPILPFMDLDYIRNKRSSSQSMSFLSGGNGENENDPSDYDPHAVFGAYVRDIEKYQMHPTQMVQQNYAKYFYQVHIMSLPHLTQSKENNQPSAIPDPLLNYLFCEMIPGRMPATCEAVRRGQIGGSPTARTLYNPSVELDSDILAVEARRFGFIPKSAPVTRTEARQKIREELFPAVMETSNALPISCWSNASLTELETLSWNLERKLFWDGNEQIKVMSTLNELKQLHHNTFVQTVSGDKQKFCFIDANATLQRQDVRVWFVQQFWKQRHDPS